MKLIGQKIALGLSLLIVFSLSFINEANKEHEFAPEGLVAYAASYSSEPSNEPQYSTQNTKTFQYLNLGHTLDFYRGDSVKVGIIDSGINYDHEDFMVNNSTKVKGDSKYYAYQTSSWVYYKASQHGYSYIDDTLGHGTNVAATVAAAVNSVGGTGLAPNVELYVYKVTNSNNGYEFGAIQNALLDAKTLGLDIINMSFQSYEHEVSYGGHTMSASKNCSTILDYYLNQAYNAGITLVGAAGNYNTDEPSYPGSSNHVINVGSLNETGTDKAGFSNYGNTIDIVAPGYVYVADESTNSSYINTQGTSFSAPLVTAAIALYIQQNPTATPSEIESALYASCDPIDDSASSYTNWAGNGALNVSRFLGLEDVEGPTNITINNTEIVDGEVELHVGDHLNLSWTFEGVGDFDDSVNFYTLSGEDNVVSVNSNGRITATGEGSDYVVIESNVDSNVYTYIYVNVISTSPTLSSISIETPPTKLAYKVGEYFDPTGLVITRHYSDTTSDTYAYVEHPDEFSFAPNLSTQLTKSNTSVSISYGGKSVNQNITVNNYRTVIEETTSLVATITYSSNTPTISPTNAVSVSVSGYTNYESNSLRLGSGSNIGSIKITSSTSNISLVIVNAKSYGSDSNVNLSIGGSNNTITSSYRDYEKEYNTATNSMTIATTANSKRAYVKSIKIYFKTSTDISDTADCIGLETFISTYMYMDYTNNLGYCKDNEHHYYSSAKAAFNDLNEHQRNLFTSNLAYINEWNRLSTWAIINGDNLNNQNILARENNVMDYSSSNNLIVMIVSIISISSVVFMLGYSLFKKSSKKY